MTNPENRTPRTALIADAAITLIAQQGIRALTHRAVDRVAEIPVGSTSYYASTRQALLELVVRRLAERTAVDTRNALGQLDSITPKPSATARTEQLTSVVAGLLDALATRDDDMRARYALLIELSARDPLHAALSTDSAVQAEALDTTANLLERFGIDQSRTRAGELMQLADSLTFTRIASGTQEETIWGANAIIAAYLRGIRSSLN